MKVFLVSPELHGPPRGKSDIVIFDLNNNYQEINTYKNIQEIFNRNAKRSFVNILNNYSDETWSSNFNNIIKKIIF